MNIIDTHAHLDHVENLETALAEASAAGVSDIIAVGIDLAANQRNLEIKKSCSVPRIWTAFGIHPANIEPEQVDATLEFIRSHIQEAVAIGETGLDYWYRWVKKDEAKKEEQRAVFRRQLSLAKEFNLPVVIHSRGAWADCLRMTKEAGVEKALFHWYSGPVDILGQILREGFYVSTSPSVAYSSQSREAMRQAPLDRILIETDCPVFYQTDDGGFKAAPKDVVRTLRALAALKNFSEEQVLKTVNDNARKFFGIC